MRKKIGLCILHSAYKDLVSTVHVKNNYEKKELRIQNNIHTNLHPKLVSYDTGRQMFICSILSKHENAVFLEEYLL